ARERRGGERRARRGPGQRHPRRRLAAARARGWNEDQREGELRTMAAIVELRGVSKTFYRGKEAVPVLENLDLDVDEGAYEALMGPSGSGKSTLLNLIAGLDKPTAGTAKVA